jgi:hypothetical protein
VKSLKAGDGDRERNHVSCECSHANVLCCFLCVYASNRKKNKKIPFPILKWILKQDIRRIQSSDGRRSIFTFIEVNYDKQCCEPFFCHPHRLEYSLCHFLFSFLGSFLLTIFFFLSLITTVKSSYILMIERKGEEK